ncbi:restriction endonuclease subunit S [Burkholderia pseudomallei]|uniref:restriction endonuclease subunit S n=1 Tax=Burkholderia pseudomallei TaxID=28450 RepID=UPI001A9DD8E7|nr:restriction endonuclease subunit S [Burkholderia pseudomallei]QTB49354.1 restriction endonuclease subunit S [Burkholderia pseudomallei]
MPAHWELKRLKYLCDVQTGDKDTVNADDDGAYPFFVRSQTIERINSFTFNCEAVLTAGDGVGVGKVFHYFNGKFDFHQRVYMMNNFRFVTGQFFFYYLSSMFYKVALEGGAKSTVDSLRMPLFLNFDITIPPKSEQSVIVAFLDRETEKIDTLISQQEKLLTLLAEKRQATISHAVTRGLVSDMPMKDSGVAWLGDVPAHWNVVKGSRVGELFGSEPIPDNEVREDGALPFIKVGSLSLRSFDIESWDWYVDEAVAAKCSPRRNFIVFPKRGAAIFTNKVNIVKCDALIDPNLMGWQIGEKALAEFIAYVLKVRKLDELADISTVPQINNKHIGPEKFPIPPVPEQSKIVEFLDAETTKLDNIEAETSRAIALLKERRSALIAAAVTGKIDVRNTMPQELAA